MANQHNLREMLAKSFSMNELALLCDDLKIDAQEVEGHNTTKERFALGLIQYVRMRDRLRELIDRCKQIRSHVAWDELVADGVALGTTTSEIDKSSIIIVRYADGDRDFALWLSLQLINQGYPVWCDLVEPALGEDKLSVIRNLVENHAIKYIFVLSRLSNSASELLVELRFALGVMQSKQIRGFVVPTQVADIPDAELTILLHGMSSVNFIKSWAAGLNELLQYLERSGVPKDEKFTFTRVNDIWRTRFGADKGLKDEVEELLSNWFPIRLPLNIYFHELQRNGIGLLAIEKEKLPFPAIQYGIYLITFAKAEDFREKLGNNLSIKFTTQITLTDFLNGAYDQKFARANLAWNFVVEILNNAWDRSISLTKLKQYVLANNRLIYYFPVGFSDRNDNKAFFSGVDGKRTWRFLVGKHKANFWHFAIQGRAILHPEPAFIVKSHALASSDGLKIWESKERLHTARRSWFKNWWNTEWRDRLLAAIAYLSGEKEYFEIFLGTDVILPVAASPVVFLSPVKYVNLRDAPVNSDDEADDENLSGDEETDNYSDDSSESDDL